MGKIMSYSFKKAYDPFFRASFKVFSPNKFGQSAIRSASEKHKTAEPLHRSSSSNNLISDT
jgi:hypothetical protein